MRQELWGIALVYNLIRLEMERVAAEAGVPPTRISFTAAVMHIVSELSWLRAQRLALGTIPSRLAR
ncbi:MAG TPA: IS4 family transposase, partial [Kofleriaceae bacterium]